MSIVSLLLLAGFLVIVLITARRRTAAFVAGFFIIFPLTYRAIDITYLDLLGPVYAREVNRFVGGNFAAPLFLYAALAFIIPLLVLFPDYGKRLQRLAAKPAPYVAYHRLAANGALVAGIGILSLLFANFIYVGTIPILQGIDRLEYERSAGIIHGGFYNLNFLINFFLGAFTVLPRLNGKAFDLRFALLMVILLMYWVITGNRFSVFFVLVSFYFMPVAAVIMAQKTGRIAPDALRSVLQRLIVSRATRVFGGVAAVLMVGGLVFNSYYNVRDYREPLVEIQERILVQPVQLWANAWERVDFGEFDDPLNDYALREILDPIDPNRNSTIQYLMTLELGYFRSRELTEQEQSYNGGFPEVHFELFGAWLPLLTLPLVGIIGAWFLSLCLALLYRNRVVTSVLGIYLFFGISLHFTGGMMTFMLTPTYWLKIAAFLIAWVVESRILGTAAVLEKRRALPPGSRGRAGPRAPRPV
jgi:hypothetical protein